MKLVVLNACYSDAQADALLPHVGCVVGMGGSIRDNAARSFAIGFYGGLGERQSVAAAYKQGRAAIGLESLPDGKRPQLKVRDGLDVNQLVLADLDGAKLGPATGEEVVLQPRSWTWNSTLESAEAGKVSVLGLVETIGATAVYAWIASRFGTLHLAISACVAPFLLLRTERSVSLTLRWFHFISRLQPGNDHDSLFDIKTDIETYISMYQKSLGYISYILIPVVFFLLMMVPAVVLLVCVGPAIILRVIATIAATLRRPSEGISSIPRNWWRCIACVDSRHPLELLAGSYRRYGSERWHGTSFIGKALANLILTPGRTLRVHFPIPTNPIEQIIEYVYYIGFSFALLLPALFYRWSIKGSALIYSPLIWIVYSSTARTLRVHLEDILKLAYYRISRLFAVFILLLFAVKVYVYCAWDDLALSWRAIPGHRLLDVVAMPEAFPPWQITSVINAMLAWVLYLLADWVLARWDRGARINEAVVETMLRWLSLARGVLSVYTIFCGIYLAASLSRRFDLPPIGTGILPWQ